MDLIAVNRLNIFLNLKLITCKIGAIIPTFQYFFKDLQMEIIKLEYNKAYGIWHIVGSQ